MVPPHQSRLGLVLCWFLAVALVADGFVEGTAYHMVDPVFTPFHANGTVNYDVIPAYAKLSAQNGVDVVLLGGSTAEWPSLTATERLSLLAAWRKALDELAAKTNSPAPILLFHSGDVSIASAQSLSRAAKATGADAILIVAPCIMRPATLTDLVATIRVIAGESDLPAIYYHYPELYSVDFPMDKFLAAAAEPETGIPTLIGVKYIDSNMQVLTNATGVTTFSGSPALLYNNDPLLAGLAAGSMGAISYTTVFPLARQMEQAFVAGDMAAARSFERKIMAYSAIIKDFGDKAAARALPEIFSPAVVMGPPRQPLTGLSQEQLPALRRALQQAGFAPDITEL